MTEPKPPKAFDDFIAQFPELGKAWDVIHDAGRQGPLTEREQRLVKLGIAMGAMREGAIRSSVRKAMASGFETRALYQIVALGAGTLGMPSTVAIYTWVRKLIEKEE